MALNSCHPNWKLLVPLFSQFPWKNIVEDLLSTSHDKSQGNLAKHRGLTALDIKAKCNNPVTFPSFLMSNDGPSLHCMTLVTNIMSQFFGHFGFECPFSVQAFVPKRSVASFALLLDYQKRIQTGIQPIFLNSALMQSLLSLTLDPMSLLVGNGTTLLPISNAT